MARCAAVGTGVLCDADPSNDMPRKKGGRSRPVGRRSGVKRPYPRGASARWGHGPGRDQRRGLPKGRRRTPEPTS